MGKSPIKMLVFVIDEHGRALTKESLHNLISEFCDNVLNERNVDIVVATGATINNCTYLADQLQRRDIATWELIYLHGSLYPPVLLTHENKENLIALLPEFEGTSAELIYKVLADSKALVDFAPE